MGEVSVSRRLFLSTAGTLPVVAAAEATAAADSDRIAQFLPPPDHVRIATVTASSVVPPPRFSADEVRRILAGSPKVELTIPANAAEMQRVLPEVDVIFGSISPEMLPSARRLRWLQATEAGMERLLFPELVDSPVVVTNMARIFAPAIAETAIGMLLALARGFNRYFFPQFQQKHWRTRRDLVEVSGMTLGIVGLGGLGSATAAKAHYGFDMRILAVDPKPMVKPLFVETLREPAWLMEMVPQVDVLVSTAPATRETEKMFNEKVFRSMKKSAYFLNLSRGWLVDTAALARALTEGWIAGAGVDVADQEPASPEHPFYRCPNLVVTCHSSGFSPQRQLRLIGLLTENVRRYLSGLPLLNVVDKQRGY
ncbi:MAG TPA: D-2-hydroxyacid dehydrogenase [Candidatus Sulfopaludibacter sp.]|nr:D-2-hydroxyacid dehydrogenase [Candidatus Sulfopaludibacter sp.]